MAHFFSSRFLVRRLLTGRSRPSPLLLFYSPHLEAFGASNFFPNGSSIILSRNGRPFDLPFVCRVFFASSTSQINETQGPAAIDYRSILAEEEFHRLADETLHDLQEKFEEYGDSIQVDGFDIDYGNHVLTLKLGNLGTYVINKQTPNRQIWLSSPVSGPYRFDWDMTSEAWVYRRTKAKLLQLLEEEVQQLCGKPITLS